MPKRALTDKAVQKLKPPAAGQVDHFDAGYPGLALRISYGGQRSWVYHCRVAGRLTRHSLGVYPSMGLAAARDAWRAARERVQAGEPPRATPRQRDSVEDVADEWLKRDQAGNASFALVRQVVAKDIVAPLAGRSITSITRRDCADLLDAIVDRGCTSHSRHVHAYLHRMLRWCVGRGILDRSPMDSLPKPGAATKRERALSADEMRRVWLAAKIIGWPFGPITQLLLLTAARRSEIGELQWREIDAGETCIMLPGARSKNAEARTIPLCPLAWRILQDGPRIDGSRYVFTTTGARPVSGWSKAKAQLDRYSGINEPWNVHDFRRTAATGLERLGTPLQVTECILGHTSGSKGGIVGVYQQHRYEAEKRAALAKWSGHVLSLVG